MGELSARDIERANFAFGIYDFDGSDTVDAFYLGDVLRALNLAPTQKLVESLGGTKKKGEKKIKVAEFLPLFAQAKKDKDVGNIDDFTEILKLYDKQGDGRMPIADLSHVLLSLGERLEKDETVAILKDCCDPEDEDGFVPYKPFLKRVMAGPFPDDA